MRRVLLSTALSLALPAAGFAASGAMPATTPMPAKGAAAPAAKWVMAAFVGNMTGSAQLQTSGTDVWMMAKVGQQIPAGSVIKTGPESTMVLGFTDGSKVSLGANAIFKMEEVSSSKLSMFVLVGKLDAWVAKMKKRTFTVRNPVSVASVRGTVLSVDVAWPVNIAVPSISASSDFAAAARVAAPSIQVQTVCHTGAVAVADSLGGVVELGAGMQAVGDGKTGNSAPVKATVAAPVEPTVVVPATLAAAPPASAPAATTEAPSEVPAETTTETAPKEPAPVNNPLQETTTASPSAP